MKTKLIFDQEGVQVYETDNGDRRLTEYSIIKEDVSFTIGYEPILTVEKLEEEILAYLSERKDSLDTEPVDRPITND